MTRILTVGVATLDVILLVDRYPAENDKVRAAGRRHRRGGNAANTAVVLSRLGHRCAWAGTLARDEAAQHIRDDLERHGVTLLGCRVHAQGTTPTSYVILGRAGGSRTIVHYRALPEYEAADFRHIDLSSFSWCHFEGRNVTETRAMLDHARARRPDLTLSLEVEKPRPDIETLFSCADLLFFSREYALSQGTEQAPEFLHHWQRALPGKRLFCTWGEAGAWAADEAGCLHHAPARLVQPVDTLGAGDTFNAGVIDACLRGYTTEEALRWAVVLAGSKCGQEGLDFPIPA